MDAGGVYFVPRSEHFMFKSTIAIPCSMDVYFLHMFDAPRNATRSRLCGTKNELIVVDHHTGDGIRVYGLERGTNKDLKLVLSFLNSFHKGVDTRPLLDPNNYPDGSEILNYIHVIDE